MTIYGSLTRRKDNCSYSWITTCVDCTVAFSYFDNSSLYFPIVRIWYLWLNGLLLSAVKCFICENASIEFTTFFQLVQHMFLIYHIHTCNCCIIKWMLFLKMQVIWPEKTPLYRYPFCLLMRKIFRFWTTMKIQSHTCLKKHLHLSKRFMLERIYLPVRDLQVQKVYGLVVQQKKKGLIICIQ